MRISCSMICWNEETTIDLSLKSIADFADEVVIVDTGSFDNTLKVAQETMDKLNLSGQIRQKKITRLLDARLESFQLCDGDWILMQDSNLVLSDALKREILKNVKRHPDYIGAVKSLNLMGDYDHYFANRPFMAHHRVFVKKSAAKWTTSIDRPVFEGYRVQYKRWAVNLSRVRPSWRYWVRGEPFDRRHYGLLDKRSNDGHKNVANLQYQWQNENKYHSIIDYIKVTRAMSLDDIKDIAPKWLIYQLRTEAKRLTPGHKLGLPTIITQERKNPRYRLIYEDGEIVGRWPEL